MLQRPLVPILLGLIVGILIASFQITNHLGFAILLAGLSILGVSFLFRSHTYLEILGLIVSFVAVGILISTPNRPDATVQTILKNEKRLKFEATVLQVARYIEGRGRFNVMVQRVYLPSESRPVKWKVRLTIYSNVPQLIPGQRILFSCIPRAFRNFRNPGCFDYERYMRHKGFVFSAPISDGRRIVSLGKGDMPWPHGMVELLRRPVRDFFSKVLEGDDLAIYSAIVLGERNLITPELREKFSRTGLSHILAVSGLHIGLVAWLAFFGIKKVLTLSYRLMLNTNIRKLTALLACVPIFVYVSLSGYQVSAMRAMVMVLAYLWSVILGKEKEIWSTLCLSALIILSIEPQALYHISFHLSYLAVIGLIWICPSLFRIINPILDKGLETAPGFVKRSCQYMASLGVITFTAIFFLMPVTLYYFHRISLVAFLSNFAVVPILGLLVIPSGLISALLSPILPFFAKMVLSVGLVGLHVILGTVSLLEKIPFSSIWFITPNWLEIGLFYAALVFTFLRRKGKWARIALVCVCLLAMADASYWIVRNNFNRNLKISFLDVGQGNCALVEFPRGKKMLIDGGGFSGGTFDVGKMVVAPFLWSQKISKIDYLVLTHPQSDHMNGLRFIAQAFKPQIFFYNGQKIQEDSFLQLMEILQKERVKVLIPKYPAETLEIRNAFVTFFRLRPGEFPNKRKATLNNCSLVLKIDCGPFAALFPGDIEQEAETLLVGRHGQQLRSEVLLCPHHGSNTSSSMPFLEAVRAKLCVISCRGSSRFRFPGKETIDRLQRLGCRVLRTDRDGMVQATTVKRTRLKVRTFASGLKVTYPLTLP